MHDSPPFTPQESLFILDCLECAATLLRGPDRDSSLTLIMQGVPALASSPEALSLGLDKELAALENTCSNLSQKQDWTELLAQDHLQLFVTARGGVPAPPYASCHLPGDGRIMGPAALAMRDRLQAADLQVAGEGNEPPDHIATQLEYLYYLLHTALILGQDPAEDPAQFTQDAMLSWVPAFAKAVAGADRTGLFSGLTAMIQRLLQTIARNFPS